ncbi:hypothetical protein JCM1840_001765 [Sporobolomyces johnsonii]
MATTPFALAIPSHTAQPSPTTAFTPFSALPHAHSSAPNNTLSARPTTLSWHGKGSSGSGKASGEGKQLGMRFPTPQPTASSKASNSADPADSDEELVLASPNAKPSTSTSSTSPTSGSSTTCLDPFSAHTRSLLPPVAPLSATACGKRPAEGLRARQREEQDEQATVLPSTKRRRRESSFLYVEVGSSQRHNLRRRQSRPSYVDGLEDDVCELGRSRSPSISTSIKPESGLDQGRMGPAVDLLRLSEGVAADFKQFTDERQRGQQQQTRRKPQPFELIIPSPSSASPRTALRPSSSSNAALPPRPLPFPSKPPNHPLQRLTLRPPPTPPPLPQFAPNPNYEEQLRSLLPGGDWIRGTFPVARAAKLSRPPPRNRSESPATVRAAEGVSSKPSSAPVASTSSTTLSLSLSTAAATTTAPTTTLRRTSRVSIQALPPCALAPPSALSLSAASSRSSTPGPRGGSGNGGRRPKSLRTLARECWAQFKPGHLGRYTGTGRQEGTNPDPLPWEASYGVEEGPIADLRWRKGGPLPSDDDDEQLVVLSEERLRALGGLGRREDRFEWVEEDERVERGIERMPWRFVGIDEGRGRAWDSRCGWAGRDPGDWENEGVEESEEASEEGSEDSEEGSEDSEKGSDEEVDQLGSSEDEVMVDDGMDAEKRLLSKGKDKAVLDDSDSDNEEILIAAPAASSLSVDQLESSEDEVMVDDGMDVEKRLVSKGKDKAVPDDPDSDDTEDEEIPIAAPAAFSLSALERAPIVLSRPPSPALAAAASSSLQAVDPPRPNDDAEETEEDEVVLAPVLSPSRPTATLPARRSGLSAPVEDALDDDPSGALKRCTLTTCPQRLYRATSSTSILNHARSYHSPLVLPESESGPTRAKNFGSFTQLSAHRFDLRPYRAGRVLFPAGPKRPRPPDPAPSPPSRALSSASSSPGPGTATSTAFFPYASSSRPADPVNAFSSSPRRSSSPDPLGEGLRWGTHTRRKSGSSEGEQKDDENGRELGRKEKGKGKGEEK